MKQTLKQLIRDALSKAHYSKCTQFEKCKCKSKCCQFTVSAETMAEIAKKCKEVVG